MTKVTITAVQPIGHRNVGSETSIWFSNVCVRQRPSTALEAEPEHEQEDFASTRRGQRQHLCRPCPPVNDRSLTQVLQKHRDNLDPNIVIDEPVKIVGKTRGIVDLMLSRSVRRHRADDIEHLIVELKAPSVPIGDKEMAQTIKYAIAVAADERFQTVPGVRWHFWAVSNNMTDYARRMIQGGPDRNLRLVYKDGNITVGIKTWAEIIEDNRARLQFFQEHLEYSADESSALRYLQERHRQFLEGVIEEPEELTELPATAAAGAKPSLEEVDK